MLNLIYSVPIATGQGSDTVCICLDLADGKSVVDLCECPPYAFCAVGLFSFFEL